MDPVSVPAHSRAGQAGGRRPFRTAFRIAGGTVRKLAWIAAGARVPAPTPTPTTLDVITPDGTDYRATLGSDVPKAPVIGAAATIGALAVGAALAPAVVLGVGVTVAVRLMTRDAPQVDAAPDG